MAIEFDIRIIGGSTPEVMQDLQTFAAYLTLALGVASPKPNTADPAPPQVVAAESNGADKPATTSRKRAPKADDPEAKPPADKPKLDRQAIIDGLTKVYSKGDEDVRLAITKFRDGQGADRLRDLKDDALPAAAELLTELRLSGEQPQV
jgi:hypothetical protein